MLNEDKFREDLSNKLNEVQFSFDESNWAAAQSLIAENRKKKKRVIVWLFLCAGLGLSFLTTNYFLNSLNLDKIISSNERTEFDSKNRDNLNYNLTQPKNNKGNILENSNSISSPNAIKSAKESNSHKKVEKDFLVEKRETEIAKNYETNIVISAVTPSLKTKRSNKISKSKLATKIVTETNLNTVKKKNNAKVKPADDVVENTNTLAHHDSLEFVYLSPLTTVISNNPLNQELLIKNNDSLINEFKKQNPFKFKVMFEVGTNYNVGWYTNSVKEAQGFNPIVGLHLESKLIPHPFVLSLGVRYTTLSNLTQSQFESKQTKYNFVEESKVVMFTPKTAHYLSFPLKMYYLAPNKNKFGLGFNLNYLLNVTGQASLYDQRGTVKSNETIIKTFGYTEGFTTFTKEISLTYQRELSKHFSFNAELGYYLDAIKDNAIFKTNGKNRGTNLKATILYTF